MNRRNFLHIGVGLSLASLIPTGLIARNKAGEQSSDILKPAALSKGDKVGLVAPAWSINEEGLRQSVERVKLLGFEPVYSDKILNRYGYFSGTDKERADEFNSMVRNPEIKGIIAAGGGYGCARILDLLDYELIRKNPKVIIGFSDNTALVNAIYQKTGLITFHGPISRTIHRDYNRKQFENIVMNPTSQYTIESTADDLRKSADDEVFDRYVLTSGKVQGKLAGGNLSLICSMVGTPYEIDLQDKIVMIEDVGEEPYRIDRMLTQLILGGQLAKAAGIAFGICKGCGKSDKTKAPNSFTLRQVIEDRIRPLHIPAVYGLSFGHNENNFTFPIGLSAELDTDNMTVKLLETAVIY
ncbi:MAG: LD-carboxypeptidase [Dysgonomonas sp.]|nr:LD-carboxypeptidase [Dysgonomonas sp.]